MEIFEIESPNTLPQAAQWLMEQIKRTGRTVVALYGQMGAGKTTLTAAFCRQMGALQTATSPTFAIVNTYDTNGNGLIFHFDMYRIETERDAAELAPSEYFYTDNSISIIEWPENIENLLPKDKTLKIKIEVEKNGVRKLTVT